MKVFFGIALLLVSSCYISSLHAQGGSGSYQNEALSADEVRELQELITFFDGRSHDFKFMPRYDGPVDGIMNEETQIWMRDFLNYRPLFSRDLHPRKVLEITRKILTYPVHDLHLTVLNWEGAQNTHGDLTWKISVDQEEGLASVKAKVLGGSGFGVECRFHGEGSKPYNVFTLEAAGNESQSVTTIQVDEGPIYSWPSERNIIDNEVSKKVFLALMSDLKNGASVRIADSSGASTTVELTDTARALGPCSDPIFSYDVLTAEEFLANAELPTKPVQLNVSQRGSLSGYGSITVCNNGETLIRGYQKGIFQYQNRMNVGYNSWFEVPPDGCKSVVGSTSPKERYGIAFQRRLPRDDTWYDPIFVKSYLEPTDFRFNNVCLAKLSGGVFFTIPISNYTIENISGNFDCFDAKSAPTDINVHPKDNDIKIDVY
ncbi:hypothetical protein J7400_15630 [Shimia sp. R9_2]|uniref:hypothetical protein n=1 Tax=Shimia sp. R9_2 TaxID=2821112 RepID=UPI001ADC9974|nr:hypothetical protein [Shimia sp. R9_2]MBO9398118.1 hypothetical protein [Shimia sp. R9_2]